jgi:hypothetical protein
MTKFIIIGAIMLAGCGSEFSAADPLPATTGGAGMAGTAGTAGTAGEAGSGGTGGSDPDVDPWIDCSDSKLLASGLSLPLVTLPEDTQLDDPAALIAANGWHLEVHATRNGTRRLWPVPFAVNGESVRWLHASSGEGADEVLRFMTFAREDDERLEITPSDLLEADITMEGDPIEGQAGTPLYPTAVTWCAVVVDGTPLVEWP